MIHSSSRFSKSAFTLVEMLVVIAIMSILMTVGSIGISSMGGKGVTSGVANAESLFDEARTTAVSRNLRSCVLVARALTNKKEEDLRRIIVAYEETNPDGTPKNPTSTSPNWVISSRGTLLPDQTFFSETFSRSNHQGAGGPIDTITDSRLKRDTGGAVTNAFRGSYFIYEFNAQGIMSKTPGASFIIGSGTRNLSQPATSQRPRVVGSAKRDFGGFVIWRNGRTSVFRSPEQMNIPATVTEF
jgi:prepilin-type N-terminal cleavage/methylation domain-containing protein